MILYVCSIIQEYVLLCLSPCDPICLSVWASSAFLFVCICHSASVVWWLRLWFLSSQHSSKYSDKTQRTSRSLRPGQSIREKTTQRSGCFCSIKQPSEQQQPFSVCDVELILSCFFSFCIFPPSSLSITISKTATNPAVSAVNSICASSLLYDLPNGSLAQPVECSPRKPGGGWKAMNL